MQGGPQTCQSDRPSQALSGVTWDTTGLSDDLGLEKSQRERISGYFGFEQGPTCFLKTVAGSPAKSTIPRTKPQLCHGSEPPHCLPLPSSASLALPVPLSLRGQRPSSLTDMPGPCFLQLRLFLSPALCSKTTCNPCCSSRYRAGSFPPPKELF